jgi:hypothetical protein
MENTLQQDEPAPQCVTAVKQVLLNAELLSRLFDEWMQGDETEQRETFETLRQSIDEDRPTGYKLFA